MKNDEVSNSEKDDIIGRLFFKKYKCIKKLGEGSFGQIYEAIYNNEHFALKFENIEQNFNLLETEATIMNYLKGPNIPFIKSFGSSGNYNILIMQLLGKSLEELINERQTFSVKTVCLLGYQMIKVLEYIHNKHFIHRDIKPDNFVLGLNSLSKRIYILDFGLAKKYRSSSTLKHNPFINKKKLTGTARYASINALRGYEQSRRDDLEAVGYVLMYFLRGNLPWQGLPGKNKEERYKKICQKKIDTSAYDLCLGFPKEFEKYIEYTRKMEYEEEPLYNNLKEDFIKIIEKENEDFDYIYDWSSEEEKKLRKKEFLEELKARKGKKIPSILEEEVNSTSKNDIESKRQRNELNSENEKESKNNNNEKCYEEEIINRNRNKDNKINTKFPTKESSIEGNNKNKIFNTKNNDAINERKNKEEDNKNNNNNNNKKEEVICCNQTCNIF